MAGTRRAGAAKLERRQEKLRHEIAAVADEIEQLEKDLGRRSRPAGGGRRRPNARRLNDVTVQDAVVALLREKKRPMHYKDITRLLQEENRYRTRSKNFLSTVAISIMRDARVRRVEPGVYALRD